MKRKVIFAAILIAVLALIFSRYALIETRDKLPDEVRLGFLDSLRHAAAETDPPAAPEPTAQPAPEPTPEPTPVPTPEPVMQNGSSGEDVKALQNTLRELGFMTGKADGRYGPVTEAAVKELQRYLDETAREEEEQAESAAQREEAAESPGETGEPTEAAESPARPDDRTDEPRSTEEAAPAADESLTEDEPAPEYSGTVDQALWDELREGGFIVYRQTVRSGVSGRETRRLQTRLISLGYLGGAPDGVAGGRTLSAIRAFQSGNGLSADGVAGEKTQKLLFSAGAKRYVKPKKPYLLKVSTGDQRVYAYTWNSATNSYSTLARTMVCSTGLNKTPTPKGTFSGTPVTRWGYFPKFKVWAQYLYRINGPILFHSVLYNSQSENSVIQGSVYKLGSKASHGCVRLSVADAKWIYENCPAGTTITVS